MTSRIRKALEESAVFSALDAGTLDELASAASGLSLENGQVLVRQGDQSDAVFVVLAGHLESVVALHDGGEQVVGKLEPGDVVGEAQFVAGGMHRSTVRAAGAVEVVRIDRAAVDELAAGHPGMLDAVAERITRRVLQSELALALRTAVGEIGLDALARLAACAQWVHLRRGQHLFEEGAGADAWYLVLSGALLALKSVDGVSRVVGEIGPGGSVGAMALLTRESRTVTAVAAHDSWVAAFDRSVFDRFVLEQPQIILAVVRGLLRQMQSPTPDGKDAGHTYALLPLGPTAPAAALPRELLDALRAGGWAVVLDAEECARLGIVRDPRRLPREHPAWLHLSAWVDERLREGSVVLLVADGGDNPWTQRVLAEADRILLVADATAPPAQCVAPALRDAPSSAPWDLERWLVLVHPAHTELPSGTAAWLDRHRVSAHFHVRLGHRGDTARLARFLAGRAVGLALSGGGARSFAHLGVAKALRGAGVPFDFFAGTSSGALMGSLLALDQDVDVVSERIRRGIVGHGDPFGDYTLPLMSVLRSRRIREGIRNTFGEIKLEDLWIPCEIVATNLTDAERQVFRLGPIWQAALASASPPGATLPVVIAGKLYCDGGVMDNLPLDVVEARGCRFRLASSVATALSMSLPGEEFPSPWALLWDKAWAGGRRTAQVPTIMEILVRAATIGGEAKLAAVRARANLFLEPPVGDLPLLDFSNPGPAIERGFAYATKLLEGSPLVERIRAVARESG